MENSGPDSGCYQLLIKIAADITVRVGALGVCEFPAGGYIYTGSAMKNFEARVRRHLAASKKLRWHIDYLLAHSDVSITEVSRFPSEFREECNYNRAALDAGGTIPVAGFGSSDCRECRSHLIKVTEPVRVGR